MPIDLNWLGISSSLQYSVCIARNSCCVSSSVGMLYIHVVDKRYSPLWPMETPDPDHSLQFQFKQKSVLTFETCFLSRLYVLLILKGEEADLLAL